MGKGTLLTCWIAGLVFTATSVFLALQVPLQEWEAPPSLQSPIVVPVALSLLASVVSLVAWIGALVLAGRLGAWGWFVAVFLLGSLGVLLLMIFGPDEFGAENDYDNYDNYNDYSGMPT